MTKLEELKAAWDAAVDASDAAWAAWAARDAAVTAAGDAYVAARNAAYHDELKKVREEDSND
jgi:hypothetical protein